MEVRIGSPTDNDFFLIKQYAKDFRLDIWNLEKKHFVIAKVNGELAGFGRLKHYSGIAELGTFGIVPKYRDKGIGQKIVNELISRAPAELYIITTIPSYCYRFGFELSGKAPKAIMTSYNEYKATCNNKIYILKLNKIKNNNVSVK